MANDITLPPELFGLFEKKGVVKTTSVAVARIFGKRHDDVIKAIKNMKCSQKFNLRNFAEITYKDDRNRKQPAVEMTRDGFTILVMGFSGKKAAAFKEAYIEQFNEMERFVKTVLEARADCPELTEAIHQAHPDAQFYVYTNEFDMINGLVLGMQSRRYRQIHGIPDGESIRPHLTLAQIALIQRLQRLDIAAVLTIPDFQARKEFLRKQLEHILTRQLIQ